MSAWSASSAQQEGAGSYSRLNAFGAVGEYSNDSSHIELGVARNRRIGALGFQYQRRLLHWRTLDLSYAAEIRPAMIEVDPTATTTSSYTSPQTGTTQAGPVPVTICQASATPNTVAIAGGPTYTWVEAVQCGTRTVVSQGVAPVGLRVNIRPGHRVQPTFSTFEGYTFSTQPVPIATAGSFNFAFEFGAGLEVYWTHARSTRIEYQVQHFSNAYTSAANPGVDSGFVKLTYTLGR